MLYLYFADDSVCAACGHPDTFESVIDSFCTSEFGMIKFIERMAHKMGKICHCWLKRCQLFIESMQSNNVNTPLSPAIAVVLFV